MNVPFLFFRNPDEVAQRHIDRVRADGGIVPDPELLKRTVRYMFLLRNHNEYAISFDPHIFGYKQGSTSTTCSKLYDLFGNDLTQTTAAAQPMVLPHFGDNYWTSTSEVTGNYISTPNAVANQITGDIDIIVNANIASIDATTRAFVAKFNSPNRSWVFNTLSGKLRLGMSFNGTTSVNVDSTALISTGRMFYRVKRESSTGEVKFYALPNGISWTQLGNTVVSTTGAMFNSTASVEVGSVTGGTTNLNGNNYIYSAKVYNGFSDSGGTLAVSFDANDYRKTDSTNQATFTSSLTGEVYTINVGTATTGYKGVLVDRSMIQFDGTDDYLSLQVLSIPQPCTIYTACNIFNGVTATRKVFDSGGGAARYLQFDTSTGYRIVNTTALTATFNAANYKKSILHTNIFNGNNSVLYVNGTATATGAAGTSTASGLTIGANRGGGTLYMNMNLSTLIYTREADNATKRLLLEDYIQKKLHKTLY